jgi:Uma2 family endonuclease
MEDKGSIKVSQPFVDHQQLLGEIYAGLYGFFKGKACTVFAAPFDVFFLGRSKVDQDIFRVLQPDICVVCDKARLDDYGRIAAPDIVVEILSDENNRGDLENRLVIYEAYGVREYWIVHPEEHYFLKYIRGNEGIFGTGKLYDGGVEFISEILPGFRLNVEEVFGLMKFA